MCLESLLLALEVHVEASQVSFGSADITKGLDSKVSLDDGQAHFLCIAACNSDHFSRMGYPKP